MSVDRIIVRPMTMADFPAMKSLFIQIDEQHYQAMPAVFKPVGEDPRPAAHIKELLEDENRRCLVALLDEQIVGYLHGRLVDFESFVHQPIRYLHISEIIVDEAFFGRGVAQALMAVAKEWGQANNASKLDLNVYAFNQRAIRFYEKEGFYPQKITMWCDLSN